MKTLILAEKSNQALAYAKALGKYQKQGESYILNRSTFLEGEIHIVAPEGHLFEYIEPEDNWKMENLPMLDFPFQMKLKKGKENLQRFNLIYREVEWADVIIIGTDSEREGERIAYSILSRIPNGVKKISKRLWTQTLSEKGLQKAFLELREPSSTYDYYLEAEARARADWLVGMNLSPLVTIALQDQKVISRGKGTVLSVGRVQTPLVRLVCENDIKIRQFTSTPYWKLFLEDKHYQVTFVSNERFSTSQEALQEARNLTSLAEVVDLVIDETVKTPPSLFDTADLQAYAASKLKIDSKTSLEALNKLYRMGVLSYPRTGSTYITDEEFNYLRDRLTQYQKLLQLSFEPKIVEPRDSHVDANKLDEESHYALIPTESLPDLSQLSREERLIYEAIVKRTLLMFISDAVIQKQTVVLSNQGQRFKAQTKRVVEGGWLSLLSNKKKESQLFPYSIGQKINCLSGVQEFATKVPKRLTEAELFGSAFKRYGLGTPATRTDIFQAILDRGYIKRDSKTGQLFPERKAYILVNFMYNNEFSNPETTGGWEDFLHQIGQGLLEPGEFVEAVKNKLKEQVKSVKEGGHF